MKVLLLSLLTAFSLPALTAENPDAKSFQDLTGLEQEIEALNKAARADLDRLREIRVALETSHDASPLFQEHQNRIASLVQIIQEINDLRTGHRRIRNSIRLAMMTRQFDTTHGHPVPEGSDSEQLLTQLAPHEQSADAIKRAFSLLKIEFESEGVAFESAKAAQARHADQQRGMFLLGGALALGILAPLLLAWSKRQSAVTYASLPPSLPPALPDSSDLLGDNYKLTKIIGRGGMGVVYEALDIGLNRKVAVKKLREDILQTPSEVERFLAEARLVAALKHPNLVGIYSIIKEGGEVNLVFEHVEGLSLAQVLQKQGKLPFPVAKRIFKDIAGALNYAHCEKIIHRDMKPANVMITRNNEVKVMDFGIAFQAKRTLSKMTRAEAWGTPPYMAPEQELGSISAGTDLYSLAVLFYEMLTGELPFKGPNYLAQKREELYRPPRESVPALPSGTDEVFKKALAPETADRYASAALFVRAVDELKG